MMKKLKSRLRNQKGESIAEVLVAVLLSAVGLMMLATMISATSKMVIRSKTLTKEYVEQNNLLVEKGSSTRTGTVEIKLVDSLTDIETDIKLYDDGNYEEESASTEIPVLYYINNKIGNVSVTSYKKGSAS